MNIVADMSLYPLKNAPVPDIIEFIHALRAQGASPASSAVGALRAAAAHRGDVCGPFSVLSLPAGKIRVYR